MGCTGGAVTWDGSLRNETIATFGGPQGWFLFRAAMRRCIRGSAVIMVTHSLGMNSTIQRSQRMETYVGVRDGQTCLTNQHASSAESIACLTSSLVVNFTLNVLGSQCRPGLLRKLDEFQS